MSFHRHRRLESWSWKRISIAIFFCCCFVLGGSTFGAADAIEEIADNQIEYAIDAELWETKSVNANNIDVTVADGIVTLSGKVKSILSKESAVRISGMTKGVRAVVDDMEVRAKDRPDDELRNDVLIALARDPATDSWEINVESEDGTVTLRGSVDSWAERELAARVVKGVAGVKSLENDIEIDDGEDRSDSEIEADIKQRMAWDVRLDDELVHVGVSDGEVTLSGTVGSAYEKSLAFSDAWVSGVKSVDNRDVTVTWWSRDTMQRKTSWKDLKDDAIRDAVVDAFLYDPRVNSFDPEVFVTDGVVTLSGYVDNLKSKRAAAQDARNTAGVVRVRNYLRVRPEVERSNEEIERDIAHALLMDPFVNRFDITADVVDGEVYLDGKVDSYFSKAQAEDLAAKVKGVTNIHNFLEVSYDPGLERINGSDDEETTLDQGQ
jgi:osmotically-inducible protein OsmY